jgi:putative flippase GtrA
MKSKFLSLHLKDIAKSVVIFFITSVLMSVYELIQVDGLTTWASVKTVLITAFGATISYSIKNFLTNNHDEILQKDKQGKEPC